MKNFTFKTFIVVVCILSCTNLVTRAEPLLAAGTDQMQDFLQNSAGVMPVSEAHGSQFLMIAAADPFVCVPPVGFTPVRYVNPDGTKVLHTPETVIDEAREYVRRELLNLGLVEDVDWEFSEEYQAPQLCGEDGWLIYVIVSGAEPFYCAVNIMWDDVIKQSNCPEDLLLTEGPANQSDIETWLASVSAEAYDSNSQISITNNFNPETMLVPGVHAVTFSASVCSATPVRLCQRTITIEAVPVDMPEAVCQDATLYLDASGQASLTPAMIDGGSSEGMLSVDIADFTCAGLGDNLVTLTVTSAADNTLTATCTAVVTVVDSDVPDFGRGNKSIRVTITEGEEYLLEDLSVLFPATDNCAGDLTYNQSPAPGTPYTAATAEDILLSAVDGEGNYAEISVKLTVQVRKLNTRKGGGRPTATVVSSGDSDDEVSLRSASAEIAPPASGIQNVRVWPNPFSDRLSFEFVPSERASARLDIFSVTGQKLATLIDRMVDKDQTYRVEYSPVNLTEGILFYRLQLGTHTETGKLIRKP